MQPVLHITSTGACGIALSDPVETIITTLGPCPQTQVDKGISQFRYPGITFIVSNKQIDSIAVYSSDLGKMENGIHVGATIEDINKLGLFLEYNSLCRCWNLPGISAMSFFLSSPRKNTLPNQSERVVVDETIENPTLTTIDSIIIQRES